MRKLFFIFCIFIPFPAYSIEFLWKKEAVSLEHNWTEFLEEMLPHMTEKEHFLSKNGNGNVTHDQAYLQIAPLKEVPNTLILVFNYPDAMNMAFLRASIFIEQLGAYFGDKQALMVDGGPLIEDPELIAAVKLMNGGGHDLRASDLLRFWKAMDQADKSRFRVAPFSSYSLLLDIEAEVRQILEPYFQKNPDTALVIFDANHYNISVVTHEISHAQYFNNPVYQKAVLDYWNQMNETDRERTRIALSKKGPQYNRHLEDLMINEFQAHLNSINLHLWPILEELHDPHYALLKSHLLRTIPGARLIEVSNPENSERLSLCSKYLLAPSR